MREMTCAICGMKFDAPRGRTTCGEECRKKYKYEQNKTHARDETRRNRHLLNVWRHVHSPRRPSRNIASNLPDSRKGKYARAKAKIVPTKCIIWGLIS